MVGFLHRVLLDQLAGEHLATLPPEEQESALTTLVGDPTWRDVLIAGLATQVNAHVNASLLTRLSDHTDVDPVDKYELIADAIAADVAVTTPKQLQWVTEIIDRVNEHADTAHRATLIGSLVSMTKHAALRPLLLTTFTRWLNAAHPQPTSPLWMLRDASVAETGILPALLWYCGHEEEAVQLNAAHAIAIRYSGDATIGGRIEAGVRNGAKAIDQAFALLCLGTGWPDWPQLPALLEWARAQITPELRVCALHLLREAAEDNLITSPLRSGSGSQNSCGMRVCGRGSTGQTSPSRSCSMRCPSSRWRLGSRWRPYPPMAGTVATVDGLAARVHHVQRGRRN